MNKALKEFVKLAERMFYTFDVRGSSTDFIVFKVNPASSPGGQVVITNKHTIYMAKILGKWWTIKTLREKTLVLPSAWQYNQYQAFFDMQGLESLWDVDCNAIVSNGVEGLCKMLNDAKINYSILDLPNDLSYQSVNPYTKNELSAMDFGL